jgi:hypothetical protein
LGASSSFECRDDRTRRAEAIGNSRRYAECEGKGPLRKVGFDGYFGFVAAGLASGGEYQQASKAGEESNQFALSMRGCFCKDRLELIASRNFGNAQFFRCSLRVEACSDDRG